MIRVKESGEHHSIRHRSGEVVKRHIERRDTVADPVVQPRSARHCLQGKKEMAIGATGRECGLLPPIDTFNQHMGVHGSSCVPSERD